MRRYLIPAAVLLAGCDIIGPKEPTFRLQTEAAQYQPGAIVEATLTNDHGGRRRHDPCAVLERYIGNLWARSRDLPGEDDCPPLSFQLGPGDHRVLQLQLPASIPPGRYRWHLPRASNSTSNPFTVVAPPAP